MRMRHPYLEDPRTGTCWRCGGPPHWHAGPLLRLWLRLITRPSSPQGKAGDSHSRKEPT